LALNSFKIHKNIVHKNVGFLFVVAFFYKYAKVIWGKKYK